MTDEEQDLLVAYLVDAGEIGPEGDVEAQSRTGTRSAMARFPARRTTRPSLMPPGCGRGASRRAEELAWPRARRRWAGTSWQPPLGFTASWITSGRRRTDVRNPRVIPGLPVGIRVHHYRNVGFVVTPTELGVYSAIIRLRRS